jgi:hypothetical protein
MKKDEAERAIRRLCHAWRKDAGFTDKPDIELSFYDFWGWMKDNHHQYTMFKASAGTDYMAELWFDQEFKLTWTR